jgi:hypothetical protein
MPDSKSQSMLLYVSMPPAIPVPLSIFYPMLWIPDGHPGPADSDMDPAPDPYPFQPNVKFYYTFSRKFQFTIQNIDHYDIYRYPDPDGPKKYGSYGSGIHNTAFSCIFSYTESLFLKSVCR